MIIEELLTWREQNTQTDSLMNKARQSGVLGRNGTLQSKET